MMILGKIEAICISKEKGTLKEDAGRALFREEYGIEGDAHAGSERQVSLLSYERVRAFEGENGIKIPDGAFGENLLISGLGFSELKPGVRLASKDVLLEITQIGKECHSGCSITKLTGKCIMPKEGVFARVVKGGILSDGDEIGIV